MGREAPGFDELDAGEDEEGALTLGQLEGDGRYLGVGGTGEGLGPAQERLHPVPLGLPCRHLGGLTAFPSFVSESHCSSLIGPAHAIQG
jgi:hypothetical protein